ncbi:MAG: outer membrane protein transport protein [Psychromonas sp.]
MNNNYKFKKTLLAVALTLTAIQASAAGFQLNAQSATGLGRAFAGDAVIADNASVMSRNAAAMALFDKVELSLGVNFIKTDISITDSIYTSNEIESDSNYGDAGDTSIAPNIHLIVPINEQFAVGATFYSNFGTKTEFDDSFVGAEYAGLTDVKSINLGIMASYRINQQWSVGAGLDIVYGHGILQRQLSSSLSTTLTGGKSTSVTALDVDADGFGLGFNIGTVFELNKNNRFGFSYHYSPKLETEGDITVLGNGTVKNDTLTLPLPDMAEFSGYHRLTDSKFAIHYSVQWIGWSAFETLETDGSGTLNVYQWKDAMHFSLGGTYYLNETWTLRSGYMYDQSAQDEITSISVPDSDRQWFSAGFTYHFSENANVDFGATYLLGQDVSVSEKTVIEEIEYSSIDATTRADAFLLAVQYSHRF